MKCLLHNVVYDMHASNATYKISNSSMHNKINTQHYLKTRVFSIGDIADHNIIKYKYHILGGKADHDITH